MAQKKVIMDGCVAATYVAYAMSDVATIFPISPITEMGEVADKWAAQGRENLFGHPMEVRELESELGAAGALHGGAAGGALATTFTNSQGLLLMIPNMYKIAGNLYPVVMHVGARSLATHALSIFGDHSDVMAVRATGFTMLASSSVQENHDLAIVAHLAAIESSVPVLHFFDAFRTANEMQTINIVDYADIKPLIDYDKVAEIRRAALNPEHSEVRGTAQNPDIFFQNREACNPYYDKVAGIVQQKMDAVAGITGRQYHLFDYVGDPGAEYVTVSMGSSCDVLDTAVQYLNSIGYKVGHVKVRLYRPFAGEQFVAALPRSVKVIATLDRDKEPGAVGEPLFTDVAATLLDRGVEGVRVIGGRYGLGSKDFNVGMCKAIYDEMAKAEPRRRFTVGINDDVTGLSLQWDDTIDPIGLDTRQVIFYGIGADGTVGATKQAANIIGGHSDYYAQAHFDYSAKKSGGYTISQLRVAKHHISAAYDIVAADYVGCNKSTYIGKYDMLSSLRDGGTFVLNCPWSLEDMDHMIPATVKRQIAGKKIQFYSIDASGIAHDHHLGQRVNIVMETVFFKLAGIIPFDEAVDAIRQQIALMYGHEGEAVLDANYAVISDAVDGIVKVDYPEKWADASTTGDDAGLKAYLATLPEWVREVAIPMNHLQGHLLPVSKMTANGVMPTGETRYEKRSIAEFIPQWDVEKCIECTECSFVCSHAAIRPVVATGAELEGAPSSFVTKEAWAKPLAGMRWRIQVYPDDCTGCASCSTVCPAGALPMVPGEAAKPVERECLEFAQKHVASKAGLLPRYTIDGSQLYTPLLEFSGACGGCGETPYVKLLTQLGGEHIVIANATGCSSVWGADAPSTAYCRNEQGLGPAWGNSLFEDNAEYSYGIAVALKQRRDAMTATAKNIIVNTATPAPLRQALEAWLEVKDDYDKSYQAGLDVKREIAACPDAPGAKEIAVNSDLLGRKSVWAIGGDGWAYDIGFAGLDHVLASGIDINILVLDTQCYSNTGGQASKATPHGACMKFNYDGKRLFKKNLGEMMMTYRNIYVASVAIGGNMNQVVQALREAESYPGPSIVIAYCPCIAHGLKQGMGHSIIAQRVAVQNNTWPIYRFNPSADENALSLDEPSDWIKSQPLPGPAKWSPKPWVHEKIVAYGESSPRNGDTNPLIVDSGTAAPEPVDAMVESETRFTQLADRTSDTTAKEIFAELQKASRRQVERLKKLPE